MSSKQKRKNTNRPSRARKEQYSRVVVETFHRSPDGSEMLFETLSDDDLGALIDFIRILDRWDREANGDPEDC